MTFSSDGRLVCSVMDWQKQLILLQGHVLARIFFLWHLTYKYALSWKYMKAKNINQALKLLSFIIFQIRRTTDFITRKSLSGSQGCLYHHYSSILSSTEFSLSFTSSKRKCKGFFKFKSWFQKQVLSYIPVCTYGYRRNFWSLWKTWNFIKALTEHCLFSKGDFARGFSCHNS